MPARLCASDLWQVKKEMLRWLYQHDTCMHFFKHKNKTILQHPVAKIYLNGNPKYLLCLCQLLQSNSVIVINYKGTEKY